MTASSTVSTSSLSTSAAVIVDRLSMVFNAGRPNQVDALTDIELSIQAGDFLSLIGPSGCGKSTLLRLIANLIEPTAGNVLVNGKSAGMISCAGVDRVHRWRNWPALVPAELVTDATLTIKQVCATAGRDVNMFHFWFYQPK